MYLFDYQSNFKGGLMKAAHAMEIAFVFNHPDVVPMTGDDPARYPLAEQMADAWIAFARTGNPSTAALPWLPYDAHRRSTMVFDAGHSRNVDDPRAEERHAWDAQEVAALR